MYPRYFVGSRGRVFRFDGDRSVVELTKHRYQRKVRRSRIEHAEEFVSQGVWREVSSDVAMELLDSR